MSKNHVFQSWVRPCITIITALFFYGVVAYGLYSGKFSVDRAVDVLSGIFGWTVGYFFAKREGDKIVTPG